MKKTLDLTENNDGLKFNIALNYGSREEIRQAVSDIATEVKEGSLDINEISEELISASLYTGRMGIPDPDLMIRTSGEVRISNYLLWQMAYTEMVFTDVLWPDFTPDHLRQAIEVYQHRTRRFGGIV